MNYINYLNDDSSDEEYEQACVRRPKVIRSRPNHFHRWDDEDSRRRFRMTKNTANIVLRQIKSRIKHSTNWYVIPVVSIMLLIYDNFCFFIGIVRCLKNACFC